MKPGTLNRGILRICRFRARRFARIAALLDYLSSARSDARAARAVALRFRKPRRTMSQSARAPARLPWIETRLEQHLHFSIYLHTSAVARHSVETKNVMLSGGKFCIERLRWRAERSRGGAALRLASSARRFSPAHTHREARVQIVPANPSPLHGTAFRVARSMVPYTSVTDRSPASLRLRSSAAMTNGAVKRALRTTRIARHTFEIAPHVVHMQTITRRRAPARLHLRATALNEAPTALELSRRASATAVGRPVELTYRKAPRESSGAVPIAAESAPPLSRSAQAADFAQQPAFRQPAMRIPAAAESRSPALDAAAVERLAEDVMRRIDKRARIERERRGI
jgi:hypothetical protein